MDDDAQMILERLESAGGSLPFNDKTDARTIKAEFGISKNAYQRERSDVCLKSVRYKSSKIILKISRK